MIFRVFWVLVFWVWRFLGVSCFWWLLVDFGLGFEFALLCFLDGSLNFWVLCVCGLWWVSVLLRWSCTGFLIAGFGVCFATCGLEFCDFA